MQEFRYNKIDLNILENFRQSHLGDFHDVFHELVSDELHIDIYVSSPTNNRDYYMIMTEGMGAYPMDLPAGVDEDFANRIELIMYLPQNWKVDLDDENYYWPIRQLKELARLPISQNAWLAEYHTMSNPDQKFFADNTPFHAVMVIPYMDINTGEFVTKKVKISNGEEVKFLMLIPLYEEELVYKKAKGGYSLFREMKFKFKNNEFLISNCKRENTFFYDGQAELEEYKEKYKDSRIDLENPDQIIIFQDREFEKAIRELYGIKGRIRHKDIGYIESMNFVDYIRNGIVDVDKVEFEGKIRSLKDLKWFTNLIELSLSGDPGDPIFFGKLKDVLPLKRLAILNMGGVILKGDLSEINGFSNLEELILTGQGITGDLKDIQNYKNLKTLYICDTKVEGDLKDIAEFTKLKELTLSYSKFRGNINVVENMPNLVEVAINDSDISGNLSSFSKLEKLQYLQCGSTKMKGNIKSLANLINLEEIDIENSAFTGSVTHLKNHKGLRYLNLQYSNVTGNISFLANFECLHRLYIEETEVRYDEYILNQIHKHTWIDILDDEDDNWEEEIDDSFYYSIFHRQKGKTLEFVEIINSAGEVIIISSGIVGEKGNEEFIDWEEGKLERVIAKKKAEGFIDFVAEGKAKDMTLKIFDYPRVNAESLVDTISEELSNRGLGIVSQFMIEKEALLIRCKFFATQQAKDFLIEELGEYEISFLEK